MCKYIYINNMAGHIFKPEFTLVLLWWQTEYRPKCLQIVTCHGFICYRHRNCHKKRWIFTHQYTSKCSPREFDFMQFSCSILNQIQDSIFLLQPLFPPRMERDCKLQTKQCFVCKIYFQCVPPVYLDSSQPNVMAQTKRLNFPDSVSPVVYKKWFFSRHSKPKSSASPYFPWWKV